MVTPARRVAGWWASCDGPAQQTIVLGVVVPAALIGLLQASAVFHPGRQWWVQACCASIFLFGLVAAVRRSVGPLTSWAQNIETLVVVPVLGHAGTHLGVLVGCAIAPATMMATAAALLTELEVAVLTVLGGASYVVLLSGRGYGVAEVFMVSMGAAVLSGTPGLVVLRYRRQLERTAKLAEDRATVDQLTGLLNRHGLAAEVQGLVAAALASGQMVGVLLIDLDHFKRVNDEYGHLTGDAVLQQVCQALRDTARTQDVVARLGGEEICVVIQCEGVQDLPAAGERMRRAVQEVTCTPPVTASIGVAAAWPRVGEPAEELVMRLVGQADGPLYEVKASGRNGVRVLAA